MRTLRINGSLDPVFWQDYAELWHNSRDRSPFQAPGILQHFSRSFGKNIVAIQLIKNDKLFGAVILKKEKGIYSFLSDLKTDVNFFVFHLECSAEDIDFYFSTFLKKVETMSWALALNNIPSWAYYMDQFQSHGSKSKLFWQNIRYSVSPIIETDSAEELLKIVNRSYKYRRSVNKLSKQLNAEFEILTDAGELEGWVQEFCIAHIQRWQNTSTPSSLRDNSRQLFLLECLRAWSDDGILVRFAVKVKQQRIAFVVGLIENKSLISHSLTFHPDFQKYSPGSALICVMADWMSKNNLSILDYGDGDEKYKYFLANKEMILNRIMIAGKNNLRFIFKAKLIRAVRKRLPVYNFYRNKIKIYLTR